MICIKKLLLIALVFYIATPNIVGAAVEPGTESTDDRHSDEHCVERIKALIAADFRYADDFRIGPGESSNKPAEAKELRMETFALATMPGIYDLAERSHLTDELDKLVNETNSYLSGRHSTLYFPTRFGRMKELLAAVQTTPAWAEHFAQLKEKLPEVILPIMKKHGAIAFCNGTNERHNRYGNNAKPEIITALKLIPTEKLEAKFTDFVGYMDHDKIAITMAKTELAMDPSATWNAETIAVALRKSNNPKHKQILEELEKDWQFEPFNRKIHAELQKLEAAERNPQRQKPPLGPDTPPGNRNISIDPPDPIVTIDPPLASGEDAPAPNNGSDSEKNNGMSRGTKIFIGVLIGGGLLVAGGIGALIRRQYKHRPEGQKPLGFWQWLPVWLKLKKVPIYR